MKTPPLSNHRLPVTLSALEALRDRLTREINECPGMAAPDLITRLEQINKRIHQIRNEPLQ